MNLKSRKRFSTFFSVGALVLVLVTFTILEPRFLNAANINNLLGDTAPLMIMALGMTPILILGSIDLSIGALASAANVFVISMLLRFQETVQANPGAIIWVAAVAFGTTMLLAVCSGVLLGYIHVKTKVPSFIASLAFMSIWGSAALLIQNASVFLPPPLWGTIAWGRLALGPVGVPLLIALLLTIGYHILLTRTPFGRGVYAIGGNERTSRLAGIPVDRIKIAVFAMNGLCTALCAIFLMVKARSAAPTAGNAFTLMAISAVVLGGTALVGGAGNVLNTIIGVFIVAMIQNGMNMVGVDVFWQNIIYGIIILLVIAINTDRSSRSFAVK